jgi:RND family efflux transporter MFP subunit
MNYETTVTAESGEGAPPPVPADSYVEETIVERVPLHRRRNALLGLLAVVVVITGLFLLMHKSGDDKAAFAAAEGAQIPVVTVVTPGRGTIAGTIEATGTLAARRPIPVGSVGEGGRVLSVPVDAGDWVSQGQVLAVVDRAVQNEQIAGARAQISVAQADLDLAQANLDRALKLVDRGFISKADVDRLTATRDSARARVGVARATLGELQARTARLSIYAPAAGLLLERNVDPGQTVGAGGATPLFTIAKGGEMELRALLGEESLMQISVGATAQVTPVGSDKTYTGQVWQIEPTIDQQTRQGTARIALAYAPGLRPGGFASATLNSGTVVAPMLPESAILSDAKGSFV